ncbi:MAG: HAD-IB family hydrolase [Coriobacteriia bacterium]|nr:HAD-IB family hydrolase [Coriobacteriia bacterium]
MAALRKLAFQIQPDERIRIVAFDFDGTLIDAASPVRLVNRLVLHDHVMSFWVGVKIAFWGMRYKMGSELDQSLPRRYIFGSFTDFPSTYANSIMVSLYHEKLRYYFRPEALRRIEEHKQAGELIILVSASFDPILKEVTREIGADGYIATQMEINNKGYYTGRTIGFPPEGEQKLVQLTAYADMRFGKGNWVITWAYGDHFSDAPLLAAAEHAVAVDPCRRLNSIAKERGWEIMPLGVQRVKSQARRSLYQAD